MDFLRIVSFVTYSPKSFVKDGDRFYGARVDAWVNQCATTHWPHEMIISCNPMRKSDKIKANDIKQLKKKKSKIKASLIGYTNYIEYEKLNKSKQKDDVN